MFNLAKHASCTRKIGLVPSRCYLSSVILGRIQLKGTSQQSNSWDHRTWVNKYTNAWVGLSVAIALGGYISIGESLSNSRPAPRITTTTSCLANDTSTSGGDVDVDGLYTFASSSDPTPLSYSFSHELQVPYLIKLSQSHGTITTDAEFKRSQQALDCVLDMDFSSDRDGYETSSSHTSI